MIMTLRWILAWGLIFSVWGTSLRAQTAGHQKTPPKASPQKTAEASARPSKRPMLKWSTRIRWTEWAEARFESAESGKPICLVLYTDWCPRCRDLMPVFEDDRVVKAAKDLVMVKQNQDNRPDWLQQYSDTGGYVPRILFFGADGELQAEITSGSRRYPYYYTARGVDALLGSIRKVVDR